jgi:hypothetical protein
VVVVHGGGSSETERVKKRECLMKWETTAHG